MQTVNISDLRANLLNYLEKASAGEQISVTTNGRLLVTITPPIHKKALAKQHLHELAATAKVHDAIGPINSEWDAMS